MVMETTKVIQISLFQIHEEYVIYWNKIVEYFNWAILPSFCRKNGRI